MQFIHNYKFKVVKTPKKINNTSRRISKITEGLVIFEDYKYKVRIFDGNNASDSGDIIIPFTDKSFNLKEKEVIFTKVKYGDEKVIRYIRSKLHARNFPGDPNCYAPFAPNWIVKGYIIEENNEKYFDFVDIVTINGYTYNNVISHE